LKTQIKHKFNSAKSVKPFFITSTDKSVEMIFCLEFPKRLIMKFQTHSQHIFR